MSSSPELCPTQRAKSGTVSVGLGLSGSLVRRSRRSRPWSLRRALRGRGAISWFGLGGRREIWGSLSSLCFVSSCCANTGQGPRTRAAQPRVCREEGLLPGPGPHSRIGARLSPSPVSVWWLRSVLRAPGCSPWRVPAPPEVPAWGTAVRVGLPAAERAQCQPRTRRVTVLSWWTTHQRACRM